MTNAITFRNNNTFPLTAEEVDDNFQFIAENVASELLMTFGAVGDGVTDDSHAVAAAEASDVEYINLGGRTYYTTLTTSQISKNYFNGTLLFTNNFGAVLEYPRKGPVLETEISSLSTKSPVVDWDGLNVLWLGTSIPHQGVGVDGYPELFGRALNCTIYNKAWSGSSADYDVNADAFDIGTVKRLSMTEDDRLAGLALYGGSSAYADGFDVVTVASQMTADYRIKAQFAAAVIRAVFLDHNHNDRNDAPGTLTPPSVAISSITIGATTDIVLASSGTFAVGDAIAIEVTGIGKLNHFAGRVQTVAGSTVTVNVDSSAFAGTFTSGTAYKLDRNTIYGAWDFLIHYIYWSAALYDQAAPAIILCGAPSNYTNGVFDPTIYSVAQYIKNVAEKWTLAFFDIAAEYKIDEQSHVLYFEDDVHPMSTASRQALTNHWVKWAAGGATKRSSDSDFLPAGEGVEYTDQREGLYSKFVGGFSTPDVVLGPRVSVLADSFSSLAGWTTFGTTIPVLATAPWDALESSIYCESNGTTVSYISKSGLTFDDGLFIEFDVWLPAVTGLTATSTTKTVGICNIRTTGAYIAIQLIVRPGSVTPRVRYFETPNTSLKSIADTGFLMKAATKYTFRFESIRAGAGYSGGMLLYLNDELVTRITPTTDSGQTAVNRLDIGIVACNTASPIDINIGNLVADYREALDYTQRFTGSFTAQSGATVTVVNGIIVSAA